jgi:hypothetical protein
VVAGVEGRAVYRDTDDRWLGLVKGLNAHQNLLI